MRRLRLYVPMVFLLTLIFSCKKEEFVGERPDARLARVLSEYENQLTTSKYGWKGHLYPKGGGGYGFLFEFDNKNRVQMMADINLESGTKPKESSYRLKAVTGPSLYFDTYSYIHILADPNPAISQGTAGWGRYSDFEFQLLRASSDTIVMKGNLSGSHLYLVRASEQEKDAYKKGNLISLAQTTANYITNNHFPFVSSTNLSVSVMINLLQKRIIFSYVKDNKLQTKAVGFAFSGLNELVFSALVDIEGLRMDKFLIDPKTGIMQASFGKEQFAVRNSTFPIIPLANVLGVQYQSVVVNLINLHPASGLEFRNRVTHFHTEAKKVLAVGTVFPEMRLIFSNNQQLFVAQVVIAQGQNRFIANFMFSFVMDGEQYKLSYAGPQNQNAQYLEAAFQQVIKGLTEGSLSFDYHLGSNVLSAIGKSTILADFSFIGALR